MSLLDPNPIQNIEIAEVQHDKVEETKLKGSPRNSVSSISSKPKLVQHEESALLAKSQSQIGSAMLKENHKSSLLKRKKSQALQISQRDLIDTTPEPKRRQEIKKEQKVEEEIQYTKIDRVMRSKGVHFKFQKTINIKNFIRYPPYIMPQKSKFKLIWDTIVLVLILYIVLVLPWQIAYPEDKVEAMDMITLVFFIFDIILNCRTTFYNDDNEEIIDPKTIFLTYIKSPSFLLDICSAFPISEIYSGSNKEIVRVLNVLKISRLLRLGRIFRLLQNDQIRLVGLLINYLFMFLVLFHWITCFWLFLVQVQIDPYNLQVYNTWIPSNLRNIYQLGNPDLQQTMIEDYYSYTGQYTKTFQYAFSYYNVLLLTLGADINPVTDTQAFFLIFTGVIGQISLAILFGKMGYIIQKLYHSLNLYEDTHEQIEILLIQKNIEKEQFKKAMEYFEYCWRKKLIFDKSKQDFSDLSQNLQRECLLFWNLDLIRSIPFMQGLVVQEVVALVQCFKSMVFMPGDQICAPGDVAQELYFIIEGEWDVEYLDLIENEMIQKTLKKNDHYGERCLLGQQYRTESVKSIGFSTIEMLSKSDFTKVRNKFTSFEEHLQEGFIIEREDKIVDLVQSMSEHILFTNLSVDSLYVLLEEYFKDVFYKADQSIFLVDEQIKGIYYIYSGSVSICLRTSEDLINNPDVNKIQNVEKFDFADMDELLRYKNDLSMKNYLTLHKYIQKQASLKENGVLGFLNDDNNIVATSKKYYISEQDSHLGFLSNKMFKKLKKVNPQIYEILHENIMNLEKGVNSGLIKNEEISLIFDLQRVERAEYEKYETFTHQGVLQKKLNKKISQITSTLQNSHNSIKKVEQWILQQYEVFGKTQGISWNRFNLQQISESQLILKKDDKQQDKKKPIQRKVAQDNTIIVEKQKN